MSTANTTGPDNEALPFGIFHGVDWLTVSAEDADDYDDIVPGMDEILAHIPPELLPRRVDVGTAVAMGWDGRDTDPAVSVDELWEDVYRIARKIIRVKRRREAEAARGAPSR